MNLQQWKCKTWKIDENLYFFFFWIKHSYLSISKTWKDLVKFLKELTYCWYYFGKIHILFLVLVIKKY